MLMEPHAADWHVIELVVKNFGQTAAYNIRIFIYESADGGRIRKCR